MHSAGPTPSLSALFASWWTLTGSIFSACFRRASALAENCNEDTLFDAITDIGCPPSNSPVALGTPPPLDSWGFAEALLDDAHATLRQVALALDEDPHGVTAVATRERIRLLFEDLAEQAIERARQMRIDQAVGRRSGIEGELWAERYRVMMAEEGQWSALEESDAQTREAATNVVS